MPLEPDDEGQPGCTPRERAHFKALLHAGGLRDAFRDARAGETPTVAGPHFSWRGGGDKGAGRYYAKGMRIDHALVSKGLRVDACDLLGRGADLDGFMGSDHCPIALSLAPKQRDHPEHPAPPQKELEREAPPTLPTAKWTCAACTFLNEPEKLACAMCSTPKQT